MNRLTPAQSTLLDALRGLSALAVLVGHCLARIKQGETLGTDYPIHNYGVIVFFAISGFLIAYSCLVKDRYSFTDYMIDRSARIFTCYLPVLMVVAVVDILVLDQFRSFGDKISAETFFANVFMLQGTRFDRLIEGLPFFPIFGSAGQFWSIPVEWWLYVLFGIVFFLRYLSRAERICAAVLLAPAAAVVLYFCTHETIGLVWVFCAMGGLAFCTMRPTSKITGLSFLAVLFFAIALATRLTEVNHKVSFDLPFMMLIMGMFFSLLALAVESTVFAAALVRSRALWAWLSSISYSLYLTHLTLVKVYENLFGIPRLRHVIIIVMASVALAWLFTWLFDRHHKSIAAWLKSRPWRRPALAGSVLADNLR